MAMIDSAIWIVVHLFYCNIICFDYSFRDEMVQKGGDETEPQNRQLSLYCIAHSCFVLSLLDLKMYTKQINFASHVLLMRFIKFRFCQLALPQSNAPCVLIRIRNPAVPQFMRRAIIHDRKCTDANDNTFGLSFVGHASWKSSRQNSRNFD